MTIYENRQATSPSYKCSFLFREEVEQPHIGFELFNHFEKLND